MRVPPRDGRQRLDAARTDQPIGSIRSAPLLHGYRGQSAADLGALRDLLLRASRLADDLPEVTELDLNPSLPPAQRAHAVIYTANYGEAGAINELGRADGLPTAVSGHNTDWWWGPGNPRATTVVVVAPGDAPGYKDYLSRFFTSVQTVATLSNPAGIRNQEWDGHVYLCTGPKSPWAQLWPLLRRYS